MVADANSPTFEIVRVEKQKRPYGVVSEWDAYVVRDDVHGLWLHSPKDSIHHLRQGGVWVVPWNGVQLIPKGSAWWIAWFWDCPTGRWTAADVCTPAVFVDGSWSYVDLELDPVGDERGFDHLADEDEFQDAVEAGHISAAEAAAALAAAHDVESAMSARHDPFGRSGWQTLDFVAQLGLPPTS